MKAKDLKSLEVELADAETLVQKLKANVRAAADLDAFKAATAEVNDAEDRCSFLRQCIASAKESEAAAAEQRDRARLAKLLQTADINALREKLRPAAERIAAAHRSALEALAEVDAIVADTALAHDEAYALQARLGVAPGARSLGMHTEGYERIALGTVLCTQLLTCKPIERRSQMRMESEQWIRTPDLATALQFLGADTANRVPPSEQLTAALEGRAPRATDETDRMVPRA